MLPPGGQIVHDSALFSITTHSMTLYIHLQLSIDPQYPGLPAVQCPYEDPDPCSDSATEPGDSTTVDVGGGAVYVSACLSLIISVSVIALAGMN